MNKIGISKIIEWCKSNYFNTENQAGIKYDVIDYEEIMDFLNKETKAINQKCNYEMPNINTEQTIKHKSPTIANTLIIGGFYGQEVTGTLYTNKVIYYQGSFNGKDYYLVENVETGFRHTIASCDLHSL